MKYGELIQFDPIESVVQLRDAGDVAIPINGRVDHYDDDGDGKDEEWDCAPIAWIENGLWKEVDTNDEGDEKYGEGARPTRGELTVWENKEEN